MRGTWDNCLLFLRATIAKLTEVNLASGASRTLVWDPYPRLGERAGRSSRGSEQVLFNGHPKWAPDRDANESGDGEVLSAGE